MVHRSVLSSTAVSSLDGNDGVCWADILLDGVSEGQFKQVLDLGVSSGHV